MGRHPNILVTGTPGSGKSTLCDLISSQFGLNNLNVGAVVKQKDLHEGMNDEFDSLTLDEDKVPFT